MRYSVYETDAAQSDLTYRGGNLTRSAARLLARALVRQTGKTHSIWDESVSWKREIFEPHYLQV